jgi:deoxyribodipyrimidine photo-lyase
MFPTEYKTIIQKLEAVDPIRYGHNRNFVNGSVSKLSPYISRGIISTKTVLENILSRRIAPFQAEKFIQELAWRDYWQQVWVFKGDEINQDFKQAQQAVSNSEMPAAVINAQTGIEAIDRAINDFYSTGYLHNHIRMYIASICCNVGGSHWKIPAQWMYYHLLDADWASNALSWQWVAGSNSNKKYFANQENINRYCFTNQNETFLDVAYDYFPLQEIPGQLLATNIPELPVLLPKSKMSGINSQLPSLIYNFYNLDPQWRRENEANRILLLEPSHFDVYPVSKNTFNFILKLSENIPNLQIFVGEFDELLNQYQIKDIYFKEHPLNKHYQGSEDARDWMFPVKGYYPSFFAFWNKCKKHLDL